MRVTFHWKTVTLSRNVLILGVLLVGFGTLFYNINLINTTLRGKLGTSSLSDEEFFAQLGIQSECRRFIRPDPAGIPIDDVQAYRANLLVTRKHRPGDLHPRKVDLNINQSDVVVLMHIQKTGGSSLEQILAYDLDIKPPIKCQEAEDDQSRLFCQCLNDKGQDWLFSKPCMGWACGLHADYTELNACVDDWFSIQPNENRKRTYHYITVIRDPVTRFFSEWMHVRRGATWKEASLLCDGRSATVAEVPYCHKFVKWSDVSFDEFMNCSSNMAFNRQTRMLANLSLSDCYRLESNFSRQERDEIMLQSAKDNLARSFAFFGVLEYMTESQILLEKTLLGMKFRKILNTKERSYSLDISVFSQTLWDRVIEKNALDVRLYQYAKDLFFQRLKREKIQLKLKDSDVKFVPEDFKFTYVEV